MELGLYTFAETTPDPTTGATISSGERLRNLIEEIELADQVELDVFGVGEHHRGDYAASAPVVVLAAAAARTKTIRLTSAVTVLSSDDPVRVFQQFSTLDLISGGRAEIMVGRGSFIESFPLFGYSLDDYDALFAEKLELLLAIRDEERVTWSGGHRAPINNLSIYPRPERQDMPIWIAVGGTPQSVARAGILGLPLAIAIIGGEPERFTPLVDLYRETARRSGSDPTKLAVGINSHGFIAETTQDAIDAFLPAYLSVMTKLGKERGWPPATRSQFDRERGLRGALLVGNPQEIIDKILYQYELFEHDRFLLQLSVGTMPHDKLLKAIELFGTKVAPVVRKEVASRRNAAA